MKKVLFVANIAKHIIRFHVPYLKWFQQNGYETHVAANGTDPIPYCDVQHHIPINRFPLSTENIKAHRALKKLIDTNQYILVHGHTPMGGVLTRTASLAARKRGTKVVYTAHGFHFYKGAPVQNWLLYFCVEKFLSRYTDAIITINEEDFNAMVKFNFHCEYKFKISGIGMNTDKLVCSADFDKIAVREALGIASTDFVLIYMAEFIERKNHRFIVEAAVDLKKRIPGLKILFAGRGKLQSRIEKLVDELQLTDVIKILGFRNDIGDIISLSDVGISSSKQEGLGLNLAEEMCCGLPIVASMDRGHKEMVKHGHNGFLFEQNDQHGFNESILELYKNKDIRLRLGRNAFETAQKFRLENSLKEMIKIYQILLNGDV